MHISHPKWQIDILFEDNHLLIVDKPAGLLSQADKSGDEDLLTLCKDYLKKKYNKLGNVYLGLVHRLDRPVSGIMVFARTSKAAARLSEQIRNKKWTKIYNAVCEGELKTSNKLTQYLVKNSTTNKVHVFESPTPDAKKSTLSISSLGYSEGLSLVKINLETGRSHQIRAQLSAAGLPIWGDVKYGAKRHKKAMDLALRAVFVEFSHPVSKEIMQFSVTNPSHKQPWGFVSGK